MECRMSYEVLAAALHETASTVSPRGLKTKELLGVQLEPECDLYEARGRSLMEGKQKEYLYAELAWYMNGSRKAEDIAKASKFWLKLKDCCGNVNSNYGWLAIYEKPGIQWVLDCLRRDPYSRQAVVLYNKPHYVRQSKDFVCTQLQHFLIRGNRLHSIVYLRSSDFIRGLSFDVPWFRFLQQATANSLDVKNGNMLINIGSSHVYSEHFELLDKMSNWPWKTYRLETDLTIEDIKENRGKWTPAMAEKNTAVVSC